MLDTVEEVHQAPFLCTSMFYGTGTKMRIGSFEFRVISFIF